jgi:hypothetical protein
MLRHVVLLGYILPGDYVEQSEHTRPLTGTSLAEIREILEVVRSDVAVDGELTVKGQTRSMNTWQHG